MFFKMALECYGVDIILKSDELLKSILKQSWIATSKERSIPVNACLYLDTLTKLKGQINCNEDVCIKCREDFIVISKDFKQFQWHEMV